MKEDARRLMSTYLDRHEDDFETLDPRIASGSSPSRKRINLAEADYALKALVVPNPNPPPTATNDNSDVDVDEESDDEGGILDRGGDQEMEQLDWVESDPEEPTEPVHKENNLGRATLNSQKKVVGVPNHGPATQQRLRTYSKAQNAIENG